MTKRWLVLLLSLCLIPFSMAQGECTDNAECESRLMKGSKCVDGVCTNAYHYSGCLETMMPEWTKPRVCSSDDPPDAIEKGYCRPSPWESDYMEVRIHGQVWEASWFGAWILQIFLNEVLEIPVSIEADGPGLSLDFYDLSSRTDYGNWQYYNQLVEGSKGACPKQTTDDPDSYVACTHIVPEAYPSDIGEGIKGAEAPLRDLGSIGQLRLFVPKYTVERDAALATFTGLTGEDNRHKLASTFKRPTTWGYYCEEISQDACATSDSVANRAPLDDEEAGSYFVAGLYTGHFRNGPEHDCELNPANCTGDVVDFPCYYGSATIQQFHHLDIALRSHGDDAVGGYQSKYHSQIWAAANATKSDVMALWYSPSPLYSQYVGTDAEMTHVIFPPTTQDCEDARASMHNRCESSYEASIGGPTGICDYDSQFLRKVFTETFYDLTHSNDVPEALWSPAYDAVVNYRISHLEVGQMFQRQDITKGGFGAREAVCSWIVDNFDHLQSFIPPTYPRTLHKQETNGDALFVIATSGAIIACIFVVGLMAMTYLRRKTEVIYYAQPHFLCTLLFGSLCVGLGALLLTIPPKDSICVATEWFINIGFALQLFPLFYRIHAIDALAGSGKTMQRVQLRLKGFYRTIGLCIAAICAFLVVWTALDPPSLVPLYDLTQRTTSGGKTIIEEYDSCGSDEDVWVFVIYGWQGVTLLLSTMVSTMAANMKEDLNDTESMSRMIYVHSAFLLLRICVERLVLTEESQSSDLMGYQSIILSANTIVALAVYVLPKFLGSSDTIEEEPLPDLFLNTTVMVADIVGFTAWCSVREPGQVFKFLEQLYEGFDKVAEKHKVFKVETVREQYVAATGIPDEQSDHAVRMAKFALECVQKMKVISSQLEVHYGPDTGDLGLRVGLHSGPVTGGFLKGKGARFQLFGDTMLTAILIHEHGEANKIQLSEETANLLMKLGRKRWVSARERPIRTNVKGELTTFWLARHHHNRHNHEGSESEDGMSSLLDLSMRSYSEVADDEEYSDDDIKRWVNFNVELLKTFLRAIIAKEGIGSGQEVALNLEFAKHTGIPLDEVKEAIELPEFDKRAVKRQLDNVEIELDDEVSDQLHDYVSAVAGMYNPNPFHNFAHASYVVMAIQKYINRIFAATELDEGNVDKYNRVNMQAALHSHTYGITSDPLTHFACVFSALIHDVDHPGVPNTRLLVENPRVATIYKNRSIAEQKSFDIAWDLLMEKDYDVLRAAICKNGTELKRFRQLVVNSLMATDLGDAELKNLRNRRWQMAFEDESSLAQESETDHRNRKATIVIEHLIQAADVAHMCQHWSIYRKWNQRFFEECYRAYKAGRAEKNPADGWYKGEIGFFDFYIIPLSEKLRDCGVFGPTSDENLNYARNNRAMWEKDGESIVAEMLEAMESKLQEESMPEQAQGEEEKKTAK